MASTLKKAADDGIGMADRIRAFDWASTPLGPMAEWPQSLRLAVELCMRSDYPTAIYWGPELRLIYNDAWSPIPAERHPAALGRAAADVWSDIWDVVGPQFARVMESGRGFSAYEQMLAMERDGLPAETYWNYTFAPLIDESGAVAGILNHGHEVTRTVLAERRLSFQVALGDRLRGLDDPVAVKMAAAEMLGERLGVARAGYGEIDDARETVSVRRDWTRDGSVPSLAGESRLLDAFGARVMAQLRSGRTLVVEDCRTDRRAGPDSAATWDGISTRALIVVPLVRGGGLRALLYLHEPEPRRWKDWEIELAEDVASRVWEAVERVQTEQRLRESEDHYRHAVELNPQVSWTARPDGRIDRVSQRWMEWTGTPGTGESWMEGLHPDDRARTFEAWRRCVASGQPYDVEHRIQRRDGSYRWARSRAFPRRDAGGEVILWYGTTEDIHEAKTAEMRQHLLINELNHRVKNTLATVQAIAFQTLKGDIPLDEGRARFEARLLALSHAHNLLTERNWEGAQLRSVVEDSLRHLGGEGERFDVEGPPLWIAPRAALALALAFHELSTNALKYGALSNEEGRIAISWRVEGDAVTIAWKERGGPPVAPPEGRGFGSRLIERGLSADLGGQARLHFEPDGLGCTIQASLAAVQAKEARLA